MERALSLGPVYALLARILLWEPDAELVATLASPSTRMLVEEICPGFGAYAERFDAVEEYATAEEYTALFVLPGGVPLRAAAWLDGELETVGASVSRRVHQCLEDLGREVAPGPWGRLPLDHLGLLLHLTAVAAEHVEPEHIAEELVAPWAKQFAHALRARAQSPVYRLAAELLGVLAGP